MSDARSLWQTQIETAMENQRIEGMRLNQNFLNHVSEQVVAILEGDVITYSASQDVIDAFGYNVVTEKFEPFTT